MSLEDLALLAQIVSLPVATLAIIWAKIDARRSHDLDVVLSLSASFRERWEAGWRACLDRVERSRGLEEGGLTELPVEMIDLLNWIDWVGSFLKFGRLAKRGVLFETLGVQLARAIELGRTKLEKDRADRRYSWDGVALVARHLELEPLKSSS